MSESDTSTTSNQQSASVERLNDDCLLIIIRQFDLNERVNLRLLNKRFRDLCDSIAIEQLVIYHKQERIAGQFKLIDESYTLKDTVYAYDLEKLFNTSSIAKSLKSIKKVS